MATVKEQRALVKLVQKEFAYRAPLGVQERQASTAIRPPARDDVWISQDVFKAPDDSNLADLLYQVSEDMATPDMIITPRNLTTLSNVPFEWIGQRNKASGAAKNLSDETIYRKLCTDAESDMVILYVHGGGFYLGSPAYTRPSSTKLAKLTKARVASVAYRLAPQNPFPMALLDLMVAWLSLIYPGEDARHSPIPPESVVLAGDSAGGALCLSLIQVILRMQATRSSGGVWFNGKEVQLPLPAGVAVLSPSADHSLSLPSWSANAHIDYLHDRAPVLGPNQPSDSVWPTNPPRADPYCHSSAISHPLVSPAVAPIWHGSPAIWMAIGEERCADGAKVLASQAARQNVTVIYSEYLGMPHIFPMILSKLPQSRRLFQEWAQACLDFRRGAALRTSGTLIHMPGDRERAVDVKHVASLSTEEARRLIATNASRRRPWTGPATPTTKL